MPQEKNIQGCRRIKVLQLGSPEELYGAERWILALIKNLNRDFVESVVAAVKDEPDLEAPVCIESRKLGFETKIIEGYGWLSIAAIKELRFFIEKNAIDIIHTHHYKTDMLGILAAMGTGCRVISTPHGWTNNPDFKLRIYELANRFILNFSDAIVPLSQGIYNTLRYIPCLGRKLHLIANGVDMSEVSETTEVSKEILRLKDSGAFVIGYIGRLTHGKGLDVLIRAVVVSGEENWHVAIVGEGEDYTLLQEMVRDLKIERQVTIFGYRPDRIQFLKGFDVFVLPSRSEGTPRCLMEAMVAGIPVVASDIAGCRNLVDGASTGLLFEKDNAQALADCIHQILVDKDKTFKRKENARKFIEKEFSASRMALEYEKLFEELVKKSKAGNKN